MKRAGILFSVCLIFFMPAKPDGSVLSDLFEDSDSITRLQNMSLEDLHACLEKQHGPVEYKGVLIDRMTIKFGGKTGRKDDCTETAEDPIYKNSYRMIKKVDMLSGNYGEEYLETIYMEYFATLFYPVGFDTLSPGYGCLVTHNRHQRGADDYAFENDTWAGDIVSGYGIPVLLHGLERSSWDFDPELEPEDGDYIAQDEIMSASFLYIATHAYDDIAYEDRKEILRSYWEYALVRENIMAVTLAKEALLRVAGGGNPIAHVMTQGGSKQGLANYLAAMIDDRIDVISVGGDHLQDLVEGCAHYYLDWDFHEYWWRPKENLYRYYNSLAKQRMVAMEVFLTCNPGEIGDLFLKAFDIKPQLHSLKDLDFLLITGDVGSYGNHDAQFALGAENPFWDDLYDSGIEWRYLRDFRYGVDYLEYPEEEIKRGKRRYSYGTLETAHRMGAGDDFSTWPKITGFNGNLDGDKLIVDATASGIFDRIDLWYVESTDRSFNDPENSSLLDAEYLWKKLPMIENSGTFTAAVENITENEYAYFVEAVQKATAGEDTIYVDSSRIGFLQQKEPVASGASDFIALALSSEPPVPEPGEDVVITLSYGSIRQRPVIFNHIPVRVHFDLHDGAALLESKDLTVSQTEGHVELTVDFNWEATAGEHTLIADIDGNGKIAEIFEDNNSAILVLSVQ